MPSGNDSRVLSKKVPGILGGRGASGGTIQESPDGEFALDSSGASGCQTARVAHLLFTPATDRVFVKVWGRELHQATKSVHQMHLPSVPGAAADGEDEEENDLAQDSLDTFSQLMRENA